LNARSYSLLRCLATVWMVATSKATWLDYSVAQSYSMPLTAGLSMPRVALLELSSLLIAAACARAVGRDELAGGRRRARAVAVRVSAAAGVLVLQGDRDYRGHSDDGSSAEQAPQQRPARPARRPRGLRPARSALPGRPAGLLERLSRPVRSVPRLLAGLVGLAGPPACDRLRLAARISLSWRCLLAGAHRHTLRGQHRCGLEGTGAASGPVRPSGAASSSGRASSGGHARSSGSGSSEWRGSGRVLCGQARACCEPGGGPRPDVG
jgi:hypothetical protein